MNDPVRVQLAEPWFSLLFVGSAIIMTLAMVGIACLTIRLLNIIEGKPTVHRRWLEADDQ